MDVPIGRRRLSADTRPGNTRATLLSEVPSFQLHNRELSTETGMASSLHFRVTN